MTSTHAVADAISAEVRAELARRKMTRRELAEKLGWTPQFLSRRMTDGDLWKVEEVARVAAELEIPVSALLLPRAS